jgi:hypothetical protein
MRAYVLPGATFNVSIGSARSTLDFATVLGGAEGTVSNVTLTITRLPAVGVLYDGPTSITVLPHAVVDRMRRLSFECSSLDGLATIIEAGQNRVGLTSIDLTVADPQNAATSATVAVRITAPLVSCQARGSIFVVTEGQPSACEFCPVGTYEDHGRCRSCVSLAARMQLSWTFTDACAHSRRP